MHAMTHRFTQLSKQPFHLATLLSMLFDHISYHLLNDTRNDKEADLYHLTSPIASQSQKSWRRVCYMTWQAHHIPCAELTESASDSILPFMHLSISIHLVIPSILTTVVNNSVCIPVLSNGDCFTEL